MTWITTILWSLDLEPDILECKVTEKLHKKGLDDLDNHNSMVTHLEPDILECKVKWAL